MRDDSRPTVDILTGFLGSGKTTLLNRLLRERAFVNTAVVVNELGDVGIDHLLVTERADAIALLEGGCLCCAVTDSLPETLLDLCARRARGDAPPFERIIIETTGLADPGPIADLVRHSALLQHFLSFGRTITVVDAALGASQIEDYVEARAQVVMADRFILTKLDLVGERPHGLDQLLRALNPFASTVPASEIDQDPARLVARVDVAPRPEAPGPGRHTHGIQPYTFVIEESVTRAGLAAWAAVLADTFGAAMLRCKGVVRVGDEFVVVQGVRSRFVFTPAPRRGSYPLTLTVIAQGIEREQIASTLGWLFAPEGSHPPNPAEVAS
jgi:G3E family GTPase